MNTILCALDGSTRARGVLDAAVALARRTDARVVLLRAVSVPGDLPIEAYASDPDEIARILEARAKADLEVLASGVGKAVVSHVRTETGVPWRVIEDVAREENASMIVIGAHGYGTVERIVGTVAAKVVNHADRTVLVVREPDRLRA